MDKRGICTVIWFVLLVAGAALSRIIPTDWLYALGFVFGSTSLPFCCISLFGDRRK